MPRYILPTHAQKSRRGGTVVVIVFAMVIILAMVAFSVEVGRMFVLRSQIQSAVDAGALAAALKLAQDPESIDDAVEAAREFIQMNRVGMAATVPEESITVDVGTWDPETKQFAVTNTDPNAVRVTGRQDNEPFFFGRVFGRTEFSAPATGIASGTVGDLDIVMVLDLSGSMSSSGRIQALRNSAPIFVDTMESYGGDDQIAVMGYGVDIDDFDPDDHGDGEPYDDAPSSLYPSNSDWVGVLEAELTDDFDYLNSNILTTSNLEAQKYGGGTPIGASVRDGAHYLAFSPYGRDEARRVMVLMSDGHSNKPSSNADSYALLMAQYAADEDVTIYTVSLGNSADLDLMEAIAEATGGKHFDATGSGEEELTEALSNAFRQIATGLKRPQLVD